MSSQLCLWGSLFFFFFCVPNYISGVHHSSFSSSAFPVISLGFPILLLRSQLYLWGSPFFFFCVPQLCLWVSFFFFFSSFCVPSDISWVHSSSSSSAFPAISLGFTILLLLLLRSQVYLWGSLFFFFCVPSYIFGVHPSSSPAFLAISPRFTILLLLPLLSSQLYLCGATSLVRFFFSLFNHRGSHIPSSWMVHVGCVFVAGIHRSRTGMSRSFESVRWNACEHRPDLGYTLIVYSHFGEWSQTPR